MVSPIPARSLRASELATKTASPEACQGIGRRAPLQGPGAHLLICEAYGVICIEHDHGTWYRDVSPLFCGGGAYTRKVRDRLAHLVAERCIHPAAADKRGRDDQVGAEPASDLRHQRTLEAADQDPEHQHHSETEAERGDRERGAACVLTEPPGCQQSHRAEKPIPHAAKEDAPVLHERAGADARRDGDERRRDQPQRREIRDLFSHDECCTDSDETRRH